MSLTPEERRRIYEEEKAKIEYDEQYQFIAGKQLIKPNQAPKPQKHPVKLFIICFVIVGGIWLFATLWDRRNNSLNANSASNNNQTSELSSSSEPAEYEGIRQKLSKGRDSETIRENILAVDPKLTYEQLKKNADSHIGKPWAFSGKITQIIEKDGQTTALISLDAWGNKLVWMIGNFTTDFVEKNQVYVVGYIAGNYSYKSIAGWDMTVPSVAARAMLKPSEATKLKAKKQT